MKIKLSDDHPYDEINAVKPKFDIQLSVNDLKEEEHEAFLSANKEASYANLYPGKKYNIVIEPHHNGKPSKSAKGRLNGLVIIPCTCKSTVRFKISLFHVSLYLLCILMINRLVKILENQLS